MTELPAETPTVSESILASTKQALGLADDYTQFDIELIMHINGVLNTLGELGIGPVDGFQIIDRSARWVDFLGPDLNLNKAQSYVYLRVKMLFDPPDVGYLVTAYEKLIEEATWRLNAYREEKIWVDPDLIDVVADGGTP